MEKISYRRDVEELQKGAVEAVVCRSVVGVLLRVHQRRLPLHPDSLGGSEG